MFIFFGKIKTLNSVVLLFLLRGEGEPILGTSEQEMNEIATGSDSSTGHSKDQELVLLEQPPKLIKILVRLFRNPVHIAYVQPPFPHGISSENISTERIVGRISAEQNYRRVGKMGCALESWKRNNIKAGVIPFGDLKTRDFTLYQMEPSANCMLHS